ncbi:MAG: murein biosynthesis integral membrane protein MurJ [Oscillospiraceae bacterium]|nr:murein biosynthesis integral membrane protein MurJ [Oscillospiraceae bacterium]
MKKLLQSSLLVLIASIITKMGGLLREVTLAWAFKTGTVTDAFVISFALPTLLLSFISGGVGVTYISTYNNAQGDRKRFTNSLLTMFFFIALALAAVMAASPSAFIRMLASGFDAATEQTAASMLRYMAWAVIPILMCSLVSAHLQAHGKFFAATIYHVFNNLFTIIGIFIARSTSTMYVIGMMMVVGNCVSMGYLFYSSKGAELRYKPMFDFNSPQMRGFFVLLAPIVLSSVIGQVNQIVIQNVASSFDKGTISQLNYAHKVQGVFTAFIGTAVATSFYPQLTKSAGDNKEFKTNIGNALRLLLPLLLPIAVGMLILAEPVVRIIYERGQYSRENTVQTASLLRFYTLTMVTSSLSQIVTRAFYARSRTKLPAVVAMMSVAVNVACIFMFRGALGARGLALAAGVSGFVGLAVLYGFLTREVGAIGGVEWWKLLGSVGIMGAFVWVGARFMPLMTGSYARCLVMTGLLVGCAVLLYAVLLVAFRMEAATTGILFLKRWVNKKKRVSIGM